MWDIPCVTGFVFMHAWAHYHKIIAGIIIIDVRGCLSIAETLVYLSTLNYRIVYVGNIFILLTVFISLSRKK